MDYKTALCQISLIELDRTSSDSEKVDAIARIARTALAERQEPVAWMYEYNGTQQDHPNAGHPLLTRKRWAWVGEPWTETALVAAQGARPATAAHPQVAVPREPTEAMIRAGIDWYLSPSNGASDAEGMRQAWRAMYDAAPQGEAGAKK